MKAMTLEKTAARNALDYQTRVLDTHKIRWEAEWEAAANPFEALAAWNINRPVRDKAYAPWRKAKDLTEHYEFQSEKNYGHSSV